MVLQDGLHDINLSRALAAGAVALPVALGIDRLLCRAMPEAHLDWDQLHAWAPSLSQDPKSQRKPLPLPSSRTSTPLTPLT